MTYEVLETCMLVPGFSRAECASWVQAWGSIVAILAAIGVAYWQRREERIAAEEVSRVRAGLAGTSILLLMNPILGGIAAARDVFDATTIRERDVQRVLEILRTLAFPTESELRDLLEPAPRCTKALVQGRNLIRQAEQALELLCKQWTAPSAITLLSQAREILGFAEDRYEDALQLLDRFVPAEG